MIYHGDGTAVTVQRRAGLQAGHERRTRMKEMKAWGNRGSREVNGRDGRSDGSGNGASRHGTPPPIQPTDR